MRFLMSCKIKQTKLMQLEVQIKFVIDDTIVFVDGTGSKNLVSNSNEDADCTISTTATALKDMQSGDLNPMTAVMSGKVKISGDMGLAMKIQSLMS